MRIAIITAVSKSYQVMGALARSNKQAYCEKHGYTYVEYDGTYPDRHLDKIINKACNWHKIIVMLEHMDAYDYIVWSDCDTLIMNPDITIESMLVDGKHMIIGQYDDPNPAYLVHTGNFIVKCSPEMKELLTEIYYGENYRQFNNVDHHEESAIMWYRKYNRPHASLIQIVPMRQLSSWIPMNRINSIIPGTLALPIWCDSWTRYKKGDFILHFSCPATYCERLSAMQYVIAHQEQY